MCYKNVRLTSQLFSTTIIENSVERDDVSLFIYFHSCIVILLRRATTCSRSTPYRFALSSRVREQRVSFVKRG